MDEQTSLLRLGFENSLALNCQDALKQEKYLLDTWEQILKDFKLSGTPILKMDAPRNLDELIRFVRELWPSAQDAHLEVNLLYRIDLPEHVYAGLSTTSELAMAVIIREFQKVWLRQEFSRAMGSNKAPKD